MFILIFIICFLALFGWLLRNHVHINFLSFFKKGFRKYDDDYGLYCFVAVQGAGKTFSVVDILYRVGLNKTIITNVKSFVDRLPKDSSIKAIYEPNFYNIYGMFKDKDDCSDYIIFYDELFSILENKYLDKDIFEFCTQFRKRRIHFYTTAQIWSKIPIDLRKLTRYQISTHMFNLKILNFAILVNEVNDGYSIKWDNDSQEYICPRLQTNIKKCSLDIALSYDTHETIKSCCVITRQEK